MRTFHFALTLCLLSLISAESSQNSVEQLCLYSQLSVTEAVVSAPFIIVDGEYAIVPEDAGNGGEIIFSIYCSEATSGVRFEAYSLGDHGGNDSFYVQFDDSEQIEWHLNRSNSWIWQEITQSKDKLEWSVDAIIGEHTFKIMQREDGTKIQSLRFLSGHDSCSFQASCDQNPNKACESSQEWTKVCDNCRCELPLPEYDVTFNMDIDTCKSYAEIHGYDHISIKDNECHPTYEVWCSDTDQSSSGWDTHKLTVEECPKFGNTTVWSNMKGFDSVCSKSEYSIEIRVDQTFYARHDDDYVRQDCNTLCGSVGSVCFAAWEDCPVAGETTNNFGCNNTNSDTFVCSCATIPKSASSKVINYDECTAIKSETGPEHEFDPEKWKTKCPENTAIVSVETKDLEPHNQYWSITKIQCCALVDKITGSQYRIPEGQNYLNGGGSSSVEDEWEAQCPPNAVMVGIYNDDDSGDFDDIDAAKCNALECPYTCGEKMDNDDCVVVNLFPASLSSCPIDYVMVGLWDSNITAFDRVRKMKCCRVLESILPTVSPTQMPTTDEPSECPTVSPTTSIPSMSPTTNDPTIAPSTDTPTKSPSQNPTTEEPSAFPTKFPTYAPTLCEPTCRSHADQLVNVLGRLLDFNTQLLRDFEPNHPLKDVLNEMIFDVERLKDQMNNVHDDMSIFPLVH